MARSLSYWEKRKAREAYEMYEEVERAALELNKIYASVSDQIERDARRIFRRFEIKFGLSEREAEKLLNTVLDPKDIKTVTGLLRRDPKNKELVAQLESQAYASRINRLAKMQDRVDEISTQILGKAEPAFDATLSEVARGSYYREIFGMQQRANAAFAFSPLTVDRISKVLAANWSGKSYSKRLWDNTEALSASVKRELMKGLLMGKSPFRMSQTIEEEFHKGATASRRLMRTEATYVANQMAMEAYKEAGTEKYIYVAILDMRTSEICQSLDKKRFLISSAEVGKNYPPMHPWCRSTTIAWMPDEMLKQLKQSAIDPATGERIEVPGDMTYKEWYARYAKSEERSTRREAQNEYVNIKTRLGSDFPFSYQEYIELKDHPTVLGPYRQAYLDSKSMDNCNDITAIWQYNFEHHESVVSDAVEYTAPSGETYVVDGVNVFHKHSASEVSLAEQVSRAIGEEIEMVPEVVGKYKGVRTPDFVTMSGARWEEKAIKCKGKDPLRNEMDRRKAENYVFDISNREVNRSVVVEFASAVFNQSNVNYVDTVALYEKGEFIKVLKRR